MAGKPFKVGRFAHTLRVRLMREHLGVDVDDMYEDDLMAANPEHEVYDVNGRDTDNEHNSSESDVAGIHPHKEVVKNLAQTTISGIGQGKHLDSTIFL
jgi:phospholipase D1/2